MKIFSVTIEYIVHREVTVEAEDRASAKEAAREMSPEQVFAQDGMDSCPLSSLEDAQVISVDEL